MTIYLLFHKFVSMIGDVHSGDSDDCSRLSGICEWGCCKKVGMSDEQSCGLYIYPHELDQISEQDKKHLDYKMTLSDGSKIVVCRANNPATCDGGYKPVDCKLFPIFPKFKGDDLLIYKYMRVHKSGFYCPYKEQESLRHVNSIMPLLIRLYLNKSLRDFYNKRALSGYQHLFTIKSWTSKFLNSEK